MNAPSRGWEPNSEWLNAVAAASPEWPHGSVRVRSVARIEAGYGLSGGQVDRVHADSEAGGLVSFIVKREGVQAVERALRFHRAVGVRAAGSVAALLGGLVVPQDETGVLVLEDIAPAEQGDVLAGYTDRQALAAVRSLGRGGHPVTIGPGPAVPREPLVAARRRASVTSDPQLEGESIRLRPLSVDDATDMHEAAFESAAELETTVPWFSRSMTLESFSAWASWAADAWDRGEHYELSILAPDGTFLGSVGLGVDAASKSANLQFWVRTTGTGRGVASEAARVVSRWALQELGLQRVEIFISEHNVPSQMAARKSGARFEGVLRNKIRWEERAYDAHIFSFVPSDFA